jgi:hypothetical protein
MQGEILDKTNIVKIGVKRKEPFGKLYAHIPEGDFVDEVRSFETVASTLTDDDVIILAGFYLMPAIHGRERLKGIVRMFDSFPENITIFGLYPYGLYDRGTNRVIERLYDVVIRVKRDNGDFGYNGEDSYVIGVEQSILRDVPPSYARYRVSGNGRLVKI